MAPPRNKLNPIEVVPTRLQRMVQICQESTWILFNETEISTELIERELSIWVQEAKLQKWLCFALRVTEVLWDSLCMHWL